MTAARLAHALSGDPRAPVLVLGCSLGTTMAMWEPQVQALGAHHQVLSFEPRGHGGSEVTRGPYSIAELGGDLVALVDSLGLERMSYCGLSLGAMIGMWFAANSPERVDRLALCCTSARLGTPAMWSERAQRVRAGGTAGEVQASIERWFTAGFRAREPAAVARAAAWLRATPAEGYAGCCEAIGAMDLRPALARITAPTLVVAGDQDAATPPEHAEAIVAAIPSASLHVVAGAAHLANLEQPAAVTRLLVDHLVV